MITVKRKIKFVREAHGRQRVKPAPRESKKIEPGSIPRISRLMAVAMRLDRMLQTGEVSDATELARLSHVTQPRMSQILALNLLAPDIQEQLLFLPKVTSGKSKIHERNLRAVTREIDWDSQRRQWNKMRDNSGSNG